MGLLGITAIGLLFILFIGGYGWLCLGYVVVHGLAWVLWVWVVLFCGLCFRCWCGVFVGGIVCFVWVLWALDYGGLMTLRLVAMYLFVSLLLVWLFVGFGVGLVGLLLVL